MDALKRVFSQWREELEERFEAVNARIEERFSRRNPDEIFRTLPGPSTVLEKPLLKIMSARHSERSYSNEPLPDPVLADLLWAADGVRENGRTTPSSFDWRETEIYVLKANGIWRWIPERSGLLFCALEDVRSAALYMLPSMSMTLPPVQLVYVSNLAKTRTKISDLAEAYMLKFENDLWDEQALEELRLRNTHLNVGIKLEAVALAAQAHDLAVCTRTFFPAKRLEKVLRLGSDERVVAVQSLGFRVRSIFDHIR